MEVSSEPGRGTVVLLYYAENLAKEETQPIATLRQEGK
jgi:hypothetical protein